MAGKFEISKRKNGEFQFNLKAGNGQVILTSEGYSSLDGCENGIESVRRHSASEANFDRKIAKDGSPYFSLMAKNGESIGKSEMYKSAASRDKGIRSVMTNAPSAKVQPLPAK
ncbi:YegP family protein [Lysobacter hankyongensis]|uniref:YegP family protein n=1 Tax=Lysobacter hankyongensis TaxID=1176535 RepID=A0ABP9AYB9_9GAMM